MGLYGICLQSSNGVYVTDMDGNTYLDCLSGAGSNNLGYNSYSIAEAYYETAKSIQHTSFSYSPTIHAVELAEALIRITPGDFPKKVMAGLSGSKSCEDAIEVIWKYTQKNTIIVFKHGYHGATWLTKTISGFNPPQAEKFFSLHFSSVLYPTTPQQRDEVLMVIEKKIAEGTIGGVLIEPILADGGVYVPCQGFIPALSSLLKNYGVFLIADEIQSGMGRTGKWWCIEHEQVIPDLLIIGKALAGGYAPISALVGRAELIDSIDTGKQIGTFIGHPPSSAAALETIRLIEAQNLIGNADVIGGKILNGLKELAAQFPDILVGARGRGLLIGLEINIAKNRQACKIFAYRCLEKGIYFGYYGIYQHVLRIAPPLTISIYDAEIMLDVIREVAIEFDKGKIPHSTVEKADKYSIGLVIMENGV
jgi:4-aminobutyrate aminotransferase